MEYAEKALAEKNNSELNGWIDEARESLINVELTRKQEEFELAYFNEQWNRVVELYNSNEILHKKCSNSRMYDKAKRVLKSSRIFPWGTQPINSNEGTKSPQNGMANKKPVDLGSSVHVKKKRQQPTRPKVSARPQAIKTEATSKGQNAKSAHQRQNRIPSSEGLSENNKNTKRTQNKKITNKPKR